MSNPSCRCCGRPLTDAASKRKGIGPDCERNPACKRNIPVPDDQFHDLPWDEQSRDVIYERRRHIVMTNGALVIPISAYGDLPVATTKHFNIPRRHVDHSPAGWEWGYGGSGPADFALNILAQFEDVFPRHRSLAGTSVLFDGSAVHRDVYDMHLAFKRDVIQMLPQDKGGRLFGEMIVLWIQEHAPKGWKEMRGDGEVTEGEGGKATGGQTQAGLFDLG